MQTQTKTFWDKLLSKIDKLDRASIEAYALDLARQQQFLRTILSLLPDGVVVVDDTLAIIHLNPSGARLLGTTEKAQGKPLPEVI